METIHTKDIYICTEVDTFYDLPLGEEVQWYGRVNLTVDNTNLRFVITIGDYIICGWNPGREVDFSNRYEKGHHYAGIDKKWVMVRMGNSLLQKLMPK